MISGEDVTHNARNLKGVPEVLSDHHKEINLQESVLEVRGEVYMTLLDFQELNDMKVRSVTLFLSVFFFLP